MLLDAKKIIQQNRKLALDENAALLRTLRESEAFRLAEARLSEAKWAHAERLVADAPCQEEEARVLASEKALEVCLKTFGLSPKDLLPKFSCATCEDTGAVNGAACECASRLAAKIALEKNPLLARSPRLTELDFSFYKASADFYKKVCSGLKTHFLEGKKSTLVISGATGTGKTYIAAALAKEMLLSGRSVFSASASALSKLFLSYTCAPMEAKRDIWAPLESEVLFIDDLGSEQIFNNVTAPLLYSLVTERIGKKTILTTNLSVSGLETTYGQRICSRLFDKQNANFISFDGQDLRLNDK